MKIVVAIVIAVMAVTGWVDAIPAPIRADFAGNLGVTLALYLFGYMLCSVGRAIWRQR